MPSFFPVGKAYLSTSDKNLTAAVHFDAAPKAFDF